MDTVLVFDLVDAGQLASLNLSSFLHGSGSLANDTFAYQIGTGPR
jgi:hypothetical protein